MLVLQYVDPLLFQLARDENDLLLASRPSSPHLAASLSHMDPAPNHASSPRADGRDQAQPGRFALHPRAYPARAASCHSADPVRSLRTGPPRRGPSAAGAARGNGRQRA
jgi:hypothetical protein